MMIEDARVILEVARLEQRLCLRNRVTRLQWVTGLFIIPPSFPLCLFWEFPVFYQLGVLYIASICMPVSYAMGGFSWNGTNAAGNIRLPIDPRHQILGRFLVAGRVTLICVCTVALVAVWASPGFVWVPFATGLFGLSVYTLPLLLSSMHVSRPLDANARMHSDPQGYTWKHYLVSILFLLFGLVLATLLSPGAFAMLLGVISICFLVALPWFVRYAAKVLIREIPRLSDRILSSG